MIKLKNLLNEKKDYISKDGYTVYKSSGEVLVDIEVNSSASWSIDPNNPTKFRLMDSGKKRYTMEYREGNISGFAKKLWDIAEKETTWGNKVNTPKEYEEALRTFYKMKDS